MIGGSSDRLSMSTICIPANEFVAYSSSFGIYKVEIIVYCIRSWIGLCLPANRNRILKCGPFISVIKELQELYFQQKKLNQNRQQTISG